ncbi:MAG: helix-turn-helix domain-containing protein [Mycoplasmatales bacterium]
MLFNANYTITEIGRILARSKSTISMEIKRNQRIVQPSIANQRSFI